MACTQSWRSFSTFCHRRGKALAGKGQTCKHGGRQSRDVVVVPARRKALMMPMRERARYAALDSAALGHKSLRVFLQDAVVLHDLQARFRGATRSFFVDDTLLHPDYLRSFTDG